MITITMSDFNVTTLFMCIVYVDFYLIIYLVFSGNQHL